MNENVIDTLKIKIVGDSSNAVDSLDKLISTIDRIKNATSGGNKGLSGIDKHLSKISAACDKINAGALSKIYKLADGLRTLNDIGNIKISSKFADRILDLGAAVECLQGLDMGKLTEMADGLKAINSVGKVNIPKPDVSMPASTPTPSAAVDDTSTPDFSGSVTMQSQVVEATNAVGGLRNALSNTLAVFKNLKTNVTSLASSIKNTVTNSAAWQLMSRSIRDVSSAVGTLAVGMAKVGSISMSFAKHIASGIATPAKMAVGAVKGLVGKVGDLFKLFKKRAMYRAMNMVISSITKGFSEGTKHVYEYSKAVGTALAPSLDKIATSGLYLKNSLGAMAAPLLNMLAPAVDKLVDKFVDLLNVVNQAFAALSGATTWTKAIKYPTEYSKETKKATKATDKLKKSILSFDELNPLHDNSKSDSGKGKDQEDYSLMFEEKQVKSFAKDIEKVLGGIFKPFKDAWDKEGAATIKSIQDKFKAMKTFIGTIGSTFKEVWTNGTGETVLSNMLEIFQSINQISTNLYTNLTKAWKANGNGKKITQNVMDAFISLQNVVKGFFDSTAEWIGKLDFTPIMTSIGNLTDKFKPLIDVIGGALLDAYNDVLLPIGTWAIEEAGPASIDALAAAFDALNALLGPVKDGLKDFWAAITPIIEWIEDVAMVVINGIKKLFEKVATVFKQKGDSIKGIIKGIGDTLKAVWEIVQPIFLMIKDIVEATFEFISEFIGEHLGDVIDALKGVIDALKGVVDFIAGVFTGDWSRAWEGIKNIFSGVWNTIKNTAGVIWDAIVQIFKSAWEGIKFIFKPVGEFFGIVWNGIKTVFSKVGKFFADIFRGALNGVKAIWNGAKTFFSTIWTGIKNVFSKVGKFFADIFRGALNGIKGIWKGVTGFFRGIRNGIQAIFSNIGSFFKNIFRGAWNGIKAVFSGVGAFFKKVWGWIKAPFVAVGKWFWNIFANAWKAIKGCFNGVSSFFKKIWEWIKKPFVGVAKWFWNIFANAWKAIKGCFNGVKQFFAKIWDYIKLPFKAAYDFFKGVFEKVAKKIKEIWGGIKDFILKVWETIKAVFEALKGQKVQTGNKVIDDKLKQMSQTPKFANGGLVNEGQMFIAREAGPELVGTIGNRTAVMNNDQIVESVAMGVADANAEQNALLREEISILRKILAKDYGSGSGGYGDILSELNRRNRRNGKTLVSIGI